MADTNMHEGECSGAGAKELNWPDGKRRWAIWEVPGNHQCSIIATGLSQSDILKLARRLDLQIVPGTPDYDIHAHFVREASQHGKTSKLVQKELERRFSGMVRQVGRLSGEAELAELWQEAYASGKIPGAYWALSTHTHVSVDLRKRAFGEIHMLSHVLGRTTHAAALTADLFAARRKSRQPQKGLSTSIVGPNAPRVCWSPENTP